jgi:DNA invertase Pin-like site-specific DNA recombinase
LRVSTTNQPYSIENQRLAIRRYAALHGFEVVRTYEDIGKSGSTLRGRKEFRKLILDVLTGIPQYKAILVHDITRWGRFRDIDEAAHYEFACRQAGIQVHYCVEPFTTQGTAADLVLKSLRRVIAAEYSRELSLKCFRGQKRVAELGFCVGGCAPYGFRRATIRSDGSKRAIMQLGEHKSVSSDRVTLVAGPAMEVGIVRRIFRYLLRQQLTPNAIAEQLNKEGIPSPRKKRWSSTLIYKILTNSKYIGCNVWNQTSWNSGDKIVQHPRPLWVVTPGAFQPLVDEATFRNAQEKLAVVRSRFSSHILIRDLYRLFKKHHKLTSALIDAQPNMASSQTYADRFGGLLNAYAKVGYQRGHRT